jgi:2-polyprenyl-6-methoxyphenol hydroxylase-like FAD-dependent oxidoreductase
VTRVPVVIVGGGPVGLLLAIELGRRGIRCLLVEQSDGAITFPTGESLSTRSMEHFRRLGLAQRVRYAGFPPDYRRNVRFVTRVMGHQLACFERTANDTPSGAEAAVSPESTVWCPKFFLDPLLREQAAALPTVDLRFGWRWDALEQDEQSVVAEVVELATGRRQQVDAEYLVGCDGGGSRVRQSQSVQLEGTYAEAHNLGIFFRAPTLLERNPHGPASQYWLVNRDLRGPCSAVDGRQLWRLSVEYPPEKLDRVDAARVVRNAVGADLPVEVLEVRPWAGHRMVTETYRCGRIFLAGDSAHLMWPRGGFGLNTGIGDAVDLAWKLAATLQGWGGPGLLDTYDLERRPIGWRNANAAAENRAAEMAVPLPLLLEEDSPRGAAERALVGETIVRMRRKEWSSLGIQLGYRYDASSVCITDGTPAPSSDPSVYEPAARPGSRAPHAWLGDGRSTLDLFGNGFTLLAFARDGVDRVGRRVPLKVVVIEDAEIARLYERRFVLVRPDGHVAWRGDDVPGDGVLDQVRGFVRSGARL